MLRAYRIAGTILNYIYVKIKKWKIMIFAFLIFIFVYVIISYTTNKTISIESYILKTPLLAEQSGVRIVLISDLHSGIYGKEQSILIGLIKGANPDLIILSGDFFDSIIPVKGAELLLSGITDIAPIYYVTGNHEYRNNKIQGE